MNGLLKKDVSIVELAFNGRTFYVIHCYTFHSQLLKTKVLQLKCLVNVFNKTFV